MRTGKAYKALAETEEFKQIVEIANDCAYEHLFTSHPWDVDCDFCPCHRDCIEFWDNHISNYEISVCEATKRLKSFGRRKHRNRIKPIT